MAPELKTIPSSLPSSSSPLQKLTKALSSFRSHINFITIHYAYFFITCLVTSLIFYGSSNPARSISYVDSLYLVVSAMTEAGLNTVNLSQITSWQQVLLWLLIIVGSAIWVSIWTVTVRMHAFEKRFRYVIQAERERDLRIQEMAAAAAAAAEPGPGSLTRRMSFWGRQSRPSLSSPIPSRPGTAAVSTSVSASASASAVVVADLAAIGSPKPEGAKPEGAKPEGTKLEEANPGGGDSITALSEQGLPIHDRPRRITFGSDVGPGRDGRDQDEASNNITHRISISDSAGPAPSIMSAAETNHWSNILNKSNVTRNGQFHSLTSEDRDRLGGVEYRALKVLIVLVTVYWALFQAVGSVIIGALVAGGFRDVAAEDAVNPWWAGAFIAVSAFNNSGMCVIDANIVPFQKNIPIPLVLAVLVLAGNTAFPVMLRALIWLLLKLMNLTTAPHVAYVWKETFEFILAYPRRVYTNLFPARQSWWLVLVLVLTNGVDAGAFVLMNIGNPMMEAIPVGNRIVDGIFQATAVRSGGFYIVPIGLLYAGTQVLYVIMMYVSAFPVVVTMRSSNIYEERSLGKYANDTASVSADPEASNGLLSSGGEPATPLTLPRLRRTPTMAVANAVRGASTQAARGVGSLIRRTVTFHGVGVTAPPNMDAEGGGAETRGAFLAQQVRGQLSHDLWWLVLAVLVITTLETGKTLADPVAFSIFNIIFEVVSAYGCVGVSIGVPYDTYSFSGAWGPVSKLVLCAVMLRGRHRGLPVAIDRAVRLPSERLHAEEEEDNRIRTGQGRKERIGYSIPT